MSHFVRASKYRHVYVESPKVSEQIGALTRTATCVEAGSTSRACVTIYVCWAAFVLTLHARSLAVDVNNAYECLKRRASLSFS